MPAHPLLLLSVVACHGAATLDDTDPHDDTGARSTVDATITTSGPIACADPAMRDGHPLDVVGPPAWPEAEPEAYPSPQMANGLAIADLTGDGRLDVLLPNNPLPPRLYVGQADGTWADESADRLPTSMKATTGASAADYDGDGDVDVFVAGLNAGDHLLRNDGTGVFEDVISSSGLDTQPTWADGASWGDVDGDGDLDLFVATMGDDPTCDGDGEPVGNPAPNRLWRNRGDGTFEDATDALPASVHDGYSYGALMLDVDGDGDVDLLTANDFGSLFVPDGVALNTGEAGGWTFETPASTGAELRVAAMGFGVGDVNGDALPDLLVSDWGSLHLLETSGPASWYDAAAVAGLRHPSGDRFVAWGGELADVDDDGALDAVVPFGHLGPYCPSDDGCPDPSCPLLTLDQNPNDQTDGLWLGDGHGAFAEAPADWGFGDRGASRGIVAADLDDDGYLDLVERSFSEPAKLYLSRCGDAAWLRVDLSQAGPNRSAIGARVVVEDGGETWTRWLLAGGTGLSSSGPPEVHFGLGDADAVDRLTIVWPDGERSVFEDVATRQRVHVTRDAP